jgi:hypothetical protein
MSEKVPILVVLGIGTDGKPHASRFASSDASLVARAANLMRFHMIEVGPENDELYRAAEKLPRGRIFSTGRGFVPYVNRAVFDKLAALVPGDVSTPRAVPLDTSGLPTTEMFTADAITTAEMLWAKIEVGTLVLAEQPELYGPGWWEGVVVDINGDELTI